MIKLVKILLIAFLAFNLQVLNAQSRFFRQYWAEYDGQINNNKLIGERTRVNDRGMSIHPIWYSRFESQANGLTTIIVQDTILQLERAELFCEMWGGHPKTSNKRFQINGGKTYALPSEKTEEGYCEYRFPTVSFDSHELVQGVNAIQFVCDRGETFWGAFLMAEIAINCYLKDDGPVIKSSGLDGFRAVPEVADKVLKEIVPIKLSFPSGFEDQIAAVHYFGCYLGYDVIHNKCF